jgi:hypothetical protein
MDVNGAKVGDDFDEEFIRKREEVWRRVMGLRKHCGGRVQYCDGSVGLTIQ